MRVRPACRHVNRSRYFADYEVWSDGMPVSWGNAVLAIPGKEGGAIEPNELLAQLRDRIARERSVNPLEIRIRTLTRL